MHLQPQTVAAFDEGTVIEYPSGHRVLFLSRTATRHYDSRADGYPVSYRFLQECFNEWGVNRVEIAVTDADHYLVFEMQQYLNAPIYQYPREDCCIAPIPDALAEITYESVPDGSNAGHDRGDHSDGNF